MIELSGITKSYKNKNVFNHLNFSIKDEGNIYTVIGPSGSGKTTLLNIIFGLDFDYDGEYYIFGKRAKDLKQKDWQAIRNNALQIVFQDYKLSERNTVIENLKNAGDFTESDIEEVLSRLEIVELAKQIVSELSGGQKQRVAIARAMLFKPKLLLLDEPTSGLDNDTTETLITCLKQLRELGTTILIISHDKLIVDNSDIVYEIKNKKLILEKSNILNKGMEEEDKEIIFTAKKKKIFRYLLTSFKANKLELALMYVPMIVIFTLFILGFSFYYSSVTNSFNRMFSGISDRIIMIDTQELQKNVTIENKNRNITSSLDGKRLYFSQEDYEKVRKIEGVKDVALTSGNQVPLVDKEGYETDLTYDVSQLPKLLKSDLGFLRTDAKINFKFQGLSAPKDFLSDYNLENLEILSGNFPDDNSLEVLIPDIYSKIYFKNSNFEFPIGKSVTINTFKYGELEQLIPRTYKVAGIYKTNYKSAFKARYFIYLGWRNEGILDDENINLETMYQEDKVAFIGNSKENADYLSEIFDSFESYQKALGLGFPTMLIKAKTSSDIKNISNQLQQYFPKYRLTSRLSWKTGEYADIYRYERNKMFMTATIISLILGVLITFLNKSYFRKRNKELAVLYSLGYSRTQLAFIILSENLIVFFTCLGFGYCLATFVYKNFLRQLEFFSSISAMFTLTVVIIIVTLMLLITLISVFWNIRGVRISNLKKSLSET